MPSAQAVDPATNRLSGESYDAEGNQTRALNASLKGVAVTAPGAEVTRIVDWLFDVSLPASRDGWWNSEQQQHRYQMEAERYEGGGGFLDNP